MSETRVEEKDPKSGRYAALVDLIDRISLLISGPGPGTDMLLSSLFPPVKETGPSAILTFVEGSPITPNYAKFLRHTAPCNKSSLAMNQRNIAEFEARFPHITVSVGVSIVGALFAPQPDLPYLPQVNCGLSNTSSKCLMHACMHTLQAALQR
jgi:hypothetical protein